MLAELEGSDWESAFSCASGQAQGSCSWSEVPDAAPGSDVATAPFNREDVREVLGISEGENDERDWIVCGWLNDGRLFFLSAGCDYTGWDCQSSGRSYVAKTWAELLLVIPNDDRERFTEVDWSGVAPSAAAQVSSDHQEKT
jgi:hypothetical protein